MRFDGGGIGGEVVENSCGLGNLLAEMSEVRVRGMYLGGSEAGGDSDAVVSGIGAGEQGQGGGEEDTGEEHSCSGLGDTVENVL